MNMEDDDNPIKWPSFNLLGADLFFMLQQSETDPEAAEVLQRWVESPVNVTVKLDGTNVGIDNNGLVVGRNKKIDAGKSYQKVDVHKEINGYKDKAQKVLDEFQSCCSLPIDVAVVYGELMVLQDKHDYSESKLFKKWYAFGVCLGIENPDTREQIAQELRVAGYNAFSGEEGFTVAPNDKLFQLFEVVGIKSGKDYVPMPLTPQQWADHEGQLVPTFPSLHAFLHSDWCKRFFLGEIPLGEGVVVVSSFDGRMFKLKHGGEECGNVPDKVDQGSQICLAKGESHKLLLEVLQATSQILKAGRSMPLFKKKPEKQQPAKKEASVDNECMSAFNSALTKEDSLDDQFAAGKKPDLTKRLVKQVMEDLVKDFGVPQKEATGRSNKFVNGTIGKLFGEWKKDPAAFKAKMGYTQAEEMKLEEKE